MQSHEIPEDQWIEFFDRFSREHPGWPVTIELLSQESGPQRIAQQLPLLGISFESKGTRPNAVLIGAGDRTTPNISHAIDLPLHIRVADDERSSSVTIQIEPAHGPITLVHVHSPIN
jgi:Family of unknown function (DUF5335)